MYITRVTASRISYNSREKATYQLYSKKNNIERKVGKGY